ncbi:MAG: hypothetical protein K8I29_07360 [Alphaproteobacteria bacterium]|uniref:Uncharacterized protein n=1 Tax=Candidatus Nitrobium versatile TaxID=2884831 RepID=A0A953JBE8_9BACT|nr:hypothetical protein [Candidatus Nitrobium versatile]
MELVSRVEGIDHWRTWFWDDCDTHGMFGITLKHMRRIQGCLEGIPPYDFGTMIYLEDAPYFRFSGQSVHVIHGPYIVVPSDLPPKSFVAHKTENGIILWCKRKAHEGPWSDGMKTREFHGIPYNIPQCASYYEFFPFRFRIERDISFTTRWMPHHKECRYCRSVEGH